MENELERIDDLHRKGYKIIQNTKNFCFGCDAVLLSAFAQVKKNETALDLGTGTGIIPILLEAKTPGKQFIGLEIQEECAEMAKRSVALNHLQDKIAIHTGDIKNIKQLYKPTSFDVVTTNPPYMNNGGGLINCYTPKAIARHELLCNLDDILSGAAFVLKPDGHFFMIHRPSRLIEIINTMVKYGLEPKKLRFIQPFLNKEPTMFLIEGIKGAKPWLKTLPTLIIYESVGVYTREVYEMYYL